MAHQLARRAEAGGKCLKRAKSAAVGIDLRAARQSLGDYLETWLEGVVKLQRASETYASNRDTARKYITRRWARSNTAS